MITEIEKTILRVIQDFCYKMKKDVLSSEFSLTISPKIAQLVNSSTLTHKAFIEICKKRKDFFYANDLEISTFSKILYRHLKKELSYYNFNTFADMLLEYKRRMENGSLKGFPKGTLEDTLRCDLSNYISYENFCEPRNGSGNSDIVIPSKKVIIETKIWNGKEYYKSGIPELEEYLKCQNYNTGYYVIFDYNINSNEIIKKSGEVFKLENSTKDITVIFIRMNKTVPSQIYKTQKEAK